MRIFLDTNVLVDLFDKRRRSRKISASILNLCMSGLMEASASALSWANTVYILRKECSPEQIREGYEFLAKVVCFEGVLGEDLGRAYEMGFRDYEDALQAIAAERAGARYIITGNVRDYRKSAVPAVTPKEFFEKIVVALG